nr:MAG TPA: hypothetical protein [Caudoviricetes sp.]
MKGFIEAHDFETGNEFLVAIGNITHVELYEDAKTIGCRIEFINSWVTVRETYEEVKALIAEAQGDRDYVSKDKLQEWMNYRMKSMCIPEYLVQFFVDLRDFIKKEED